ncbi:LysR family transcriptional regulator [Neobacillus drentensis]|uniref:LysR family transcriptional regulator n=1 Tax=Neobacillus drentensis TaxID=220684 RepID=UPI001F15CACC|nr:LysR family transcriptional regulator [Neobacillus drentensis]ULT57044.1 LysR family transcriptional regulator [Neobacillus drentensis]
MELRHLQTFQIVAEELNLSRAAMRLNYSQPTVTKHLKILEEEVGMPLFEKKDGKKVLTKAGEILYKHSKNVLSEMFQLSHDFLFFKEQKTIIRVGGLENYCYNYFLPKIRTFLDKYPDVTAEVHAVSNDNALKQVLNQELDFGIAVGKQSTADVIDCVLGYEDLVLFASSKIAKDNSYLEYCIEHYPVLLDHRANYIYYGFLKQGVTFPRMVHCNSDEAVKEGVLNHSYLGMLGTGRLKEEIESGEITILHTYSSHVPVKIFTHKSNLDIPLFKQFFHSFQR